MTNPIPPGVLVRRLKAVIRRAEKLSSSRRNSFMSWDAGAVNSWSRKAEAASNQKRPPWPAMCTSACCAS